MLKPILFSCLTLVIFPSYAMKQDPADFNRELINLIKWSSQSNKQTLIAGIENLIDFGANVNILILKKTDNGKIELTFLQLTLQEVTNVDFKKGICEVFLKKGANPNANSSLGFAAACATGDWELFELFINYGANIYAKDPVGKTMLHHAAAGGNLAICEHLLSEGLKVNAVDDQGNTLLHIAAENKHRELCNYLLNMGLKINVYNHTGKTPLALAGLITASVDSGRENADKNRNAFQLSREICQDMIVHQVRLNKNAHTLLGCIKKLSNTGDLAAASLYRERNSLLKPYLLEHFCLLSDALKDQTPYKNLIHFRSEVYGYGRQYPRYGHNLPKHEYQWGSDDYCGFLLPNAIQYTKNLSRPHVTANWAVQEVLPLHNLAIPQEPAAPIATIDNGNNNNIPVPPAPPAREEIFLALPVKALQRPVPFPGPATIQPPVPDVLQAALERIEGINRPFWEQVRSQRTPQRFTENNGMSSRIPLTTTQGSWSKTMNTIAALGLIAVIAVIVYIWGQDEKENEQEGESEFLKSTPEQILSS